MNAEKNTRGQNLAIAGIILAGTGLLLSALVLHLILAVPAPSPDSQPTPLVVPGKQMLVLEWNFDFTAEHREKINFSVFNSAPTALTNVVVEAYLRFPDQDINSQQFNSLTHQQIKIGMLNSGEKTNEYSILLGEEYPEEDYLAYIFLKATSAEGEYGFLSTKVFTIRKYSSGEFFDKTFCQKIDPYSLDVRMAASEAVKNHPGPYSIEQALDVYEWVKENIKYLNVPVNLPATPYSPSETLATKSGDCKNQAVLVASMIESLGGRAMVVAQPSCQHAYAVVHYADYNADPGPAISALSRRYVRCSKGFICGGTCWNYPTYYGAYCDGTTATESYDCPQGQVSFTDNLCHYCTAGLTLVFQDGTTNCEERSEFSLREFNFKSGRFIVFDTAGGRYAGNYLPECFEDQNVQRYFIKSCVTPPE